MSEQVAKRWVRELWWAIGGCTALAFVAAADQGAGPPVIPPPCASDIDLASALIPLPPDDDVLPPSQVQLAIEPPLSSSITFPATPMTARGQSTAAPMPLITLPSPPPMAVPTLAEPAPTPATMEPPVVAYEPTPAPEEAATPDHALQPEPTPELVAQLPQDSSVPPPLPTPPVAADPLPTPAIDAELPTTEPAPIEVAPQLAPSEAMPAPAPAAASPLSDCQPGCACGPNGAPGQNGCCAAGAGCHEDTGVSFPSTVHRDILELLAVDVARRALLALHPYAADQPIVTLDVIVRPSGHEVHTYARLEWYRHHWWQASDVRKTYQSEVSMSMVYHPDHRRLHDISYVDNAWLPFRNVDMSSQVVASYNEDFALRDETGLPPKFLSDRIDVLEPYIEPRIANRGPIQEPDPRAKSLRVVRRDSNVTANQ
jgi:hypothetical protein